MPCQECQRLESELERAEHAYFTALAVMNAYVGDPREQERHQLRTAVHKAMQARDLAATGRRAHQKAGHPRVRRALRAGSV